MLTSSKKCFLAWEKKYSADIQDENLQNLYNLRGNTDNQLLNRYMRRSRSKTAIKNEKSYYLISDYSSRRSVNTCSTRITQRHIHSSMARKVIV